MEYDSVIKNIGGFFIYAKPYSPMDMFSERES
jgi:hypothetical protein